MSKRNSNNSDLAMLMSPHNGCKSMDNNNVVPKTKKKQLARRMPKDKSKNFAPVGGKKSCHDQEKKRLRQQKKRKRYDDDDDDNDSEYEDDGKSM